MPLTTMFGDPRWWGDYEVSCDVLLEQDGSIELIGRIAAQARERIAGYHLQIGSDGRWRLYSQDLKNVRDADEELAAGEVAFPAGQWHTVALRMRDREIAVVVDERTLGTIRDDRHLTGNVGLRVGGWQHAQFDNSNKGMIARYKIALSEDGRDFADVAGGRWAISSATKVAGWPARRARFVRLEAAQDTASAGEINIATTPIVRAPGH